MSTIPPQPSGQFLSGFLYAAAAAFFWSLIGPFTKGCLAFGVTAMETAIWRALLGGLCFAGQTALAGGLRIPLRHAALFFFFGVLSIGVLFSCFQLGIHLSGAAMTMVLLYTAPAWVAIFSWFFFHEVISRRKLLAIAIALAGVTLVCFSGGSLPGSLSVPGIICGLLSGIAFASQLPFYVWWKTRYPASTIYTYMLLGGTVAMLPFTDFAPDKPWDVWLNLLALGVVTNYLAYVALAMSLQRISQVHTAVIGNLEPVLGTLWVWMFFGENFIPTGWLGSCLVMSAVFLLTSKGKEF
ncbi:MAG: EamA family transporter [Desulfovibrio sp.]|jgi:DME family drug/metabolite transporter|nr:EamA family transporter [Desulfovibrio sp.]